MTGHHAVLCTQVLPLHSGTPILEPRQEDLCDNPMGISANQQFSLELIWTPVTFPVECF